MKFTANQLTELQADAIRVVADIRHGDEDMPADYPFRTGDTWDVTVDIATGQIYDWPKDGPPLDLHMKVCDGGCYYLMDGGMPIASLVNEYVPKCVPGEWGDYLMFNINATGRITNWKCSPEQIVGSFYRDDD